MQQPPGSDGDHVFLDAYFRQLAADKDLPKYSLERRIDTLVGVLLPDLLSQLDGGDVRYVTCELPLKKPGNNQSTNLDHVYFDVDRNRWLLVELKTDRGSVSREQVEIYVLAAPRGMAELIADVRIIQKASSAKNKYDAVIQRLSVHDAGAPIELLYLAPELPAGTFTPNVRTLTFAQLAKLEHRTYPDVWDLFRRVLIPMLQ